MPTIHRVALLGFSDFERSTLASCFRLATRREPAYVLAPTAAQAHFLVANADHAATVLDVTAAGRVDDTVFIGNRPPPGATAWMLRPIDPVHVMRELDAMAALQQMEAARAPPGPPPTAALPLSPAAEAPAVAEACPAPDTPAALAAPEVPAAPHPAAPVPLPALPGAWPPPAAAPTARQDVHEPVLTPPPPPPAVAAGTPQALLVDDSEIACAYLARRLHDWGVQCTTAANSTRALELLTRQRFDLVFMDVELGPGSALDGLALCQRLRRRHPAHGEGAPLLAMVSAHHRELDRVRGALAGADAYLGKPLDGDELAQVLRRHGLKSTSGPAR